MNKRDLSTLILLFALLFGGWMRFYPALGGNFPVNDGGMFYVMINDLRANNYQLPETTTYNNINIPFAYPPLGFYLGAAVSDLLGISALVTLQWLPALINSLCVLAFFMLARELLKDPLQAAIASVIYALTPQMMAWLSMGGGLTRSPGHLFMLLTLYFAHRLFTRGDKKDIALASLCGALTILSHPEASVFAIGLSAYLWLAIARNGRGLLRGVIVAVGVITLCAPWLATILTRHGAETILAAMRTGGQTWLSIFFLFNIDYITEEPLFHLFGAIGVFGLITLLIRRDYLIPGMFLATVLIQPRSAYTVGNISLALAGSAFLVDVLFPALARLNKPNAEPTAPEFFRSRTSITIFLSVLIPYAALNILSFGGNLAQNRPSAAEIAAMQWAKNNTPAESRFIVITGETIAVCDSISEWFPALSNRTSLNTLQGREWALGTEFPNFNQQTIRLQPCINDGLACLEEKSAYFGDGFEYLYITIQRPVEKCRTSVTVKHITRGLVSGLEASPQYQSVYQTPEVIIFKRAK